MMKFLTGACALLVSGSLAACGGESSADPGSGERPSLRFAVTEMKGLEQLQREFGAFETTLEDAADVDLELFPVSNRTAAAVALESDRVDLVFTGPAEYVALNARADVVPVVAIRRPGYSSCIWTTTSSGVSSLEDLRGKSIAMEDVGSTSAHLGPAQLLSDAGLDPQDDVRVQFLGSAMQEALKRGDVAAVGGGCHDYDEFMAEEDSPDDFPLLERGHQLPDDVIVAHPDVDEAVVEQVRTAFQDEWEDLRAAMVEGEENEKFAEAELVGEPADADYDIVRSMYESVGVNDFSEFVG